MILKSFIVAIISTLPLACAAQKTKSEVAWTTKCKPIEEAISEVSKTGEYNVSNLEKVHKRNLEVSGCDDGFYAEGMSDIVVKSLAADFKEIVTYALSDNSLESFLLKHIDSSADWTDLDKIATRSKTSCPLKAKALCEKITRLSKKASEDAKTAAKNR